MTNASPPPEPDIRYQPPRPKRYQPKIGLLGCGTITGVHLDGYRKAGFNVVALCDLNRAAAEKRRQEFFPDADVLTDPQALLGRKDIEVVDIALHPGDRLPLIEAAITAGKHVLSQKPFVLNLDDGERLADLADSHGVKLAVNQNGRWAPYFRYTREAVRQGLIGSLQSIVFALNWDHSRIKGSVFEKIHHVILYDFAIHWFDMVNLLVGERAIGPVTAQVAVADDQPVAPPLLAAAQLPFAGGFASLTFDAYSRYDRLQQMVVTGSDGTIRCQGGNVTARDLSLTTEAGTVRPDLEGDWLPDGFAGTMGELLCAIEEGRQPENNARDNLSSLALCFAAIRAAETGQPQPVGSVRTASDGCFPRD
ncbi:MAG: Gfo/Idh/MocA family protein [Opitutales bacterium]